MAVCNKNLRPRLPESLHPGRAGLFRRFGSGYLDMGTHPREWCCCLNEVSHPQLPVGVSKLLRTSWDTDPSKRPLFREVAGKMRKFVEHVLLVSAKLWVY